jgi:hypothetical protein
MSNIKANITLLLLLAAISELCTPSTTRFALFVILVSASKCVFFYPCLNCRVIYTVFIVHTTTPQPPIRHISKFKKKETHLRVYNNSHVKQLHGICITLRNRHCYTLCRSLTYCRTIRKLKLATMFAAYRCTVGTGCIPVGWLSHSAGSCVAAVRYYDALTHKAITRIHAVR